MFKKEIKKSLKKNQVEIMEMKSTIDEIKNATQSFDNRLK